MYKGNSSRIVPIIVVAVVAIIAIFAIVSLGRAIFTRTDAPVIVDASQQDLLKTSVDRGVQMTVRGPIVANENFRSYRITITPEARTLVTYSGYLGAVLSKKTLSNNVPAYEQFVFALDRANMIKGVQLEGDADDTRGRCATGQIYEFDTLRDDTSTKHLWTSTCKGSRGSFTASVSQVQGLFLNQIPQSSTLLRDVNF